MVFCFYLKKPRLFYNRNTPPPPQKKGVRQAPGSPHPQETKILADDATRDLEKAMPALDAAVDALEKLDKKSIAEARSGFLAVF